MTRLSKTGDLGESKKKLEKKCYPYTLLTYNVKLPNSNLKGGIGFAKWNRYPDTGDKYHCADFFSSDICNRVTKCYLPKKTLEDIRKLESYKRAV